MNVLVLGGNNPRHAEWVRELGAALTKTGHTVFLHDYAHWKSGAALADIDTEIGRISKKLHGKRDFVIVAKSIGTVIATLGLARGAFRAISCVLLGVPHNGIAAEIKDFAPGLSSLPKTTFIQNEYDPCGSAVGLDALLEQSYLMVYDLEVVFDNHTHDYFDFNLIARAIR